MKGKKLISLIGIFLIMILVFTGCAKEKEVDKVNTNIADENPEDNIIKEDNGEDEGEKIMKEFEEILKASPSPQELIKFMDKNIDRVSPIDGDEMVDRLEISLKDNISAYGDIILKLDKDNELMDISGEDFQFDQSRIDDIKNEELKNEVNKLYLNMYKLENLEGGFYPIIDYGKLKTYKDHITEEWKDYLMIKSLDSDNRPMSDGGLNISFDELAHRILKTENYLNKYVNGQRQKEMLENYESKIYAYMKGLPNTPIANRDTKKIYDDLVESYKKTGNNQGYITSNMIYEYLEDIKGNDYIIDENIFKKADELIEEALRILREFK